MDDSAQQYSATCKYRNSNISATGFCKSPLQISIFTQKPRSYRFISYICEAKVSEPAEI